MVAAHRDQHRLTEQPAGTDAPVLGPFPTPVAGAAYAIANVSWTAATVPYPSRGPR
ncbi:MAG: hypothetical protein QG608_1100 [Actinomycetota bacterium]|nr:hypothetical protein [Actinomycetota bacterium]